MLELLGFEADFSLMLAEKNANKNNVYYVTAHIVRAVSALNQVFAINEEYGLNEKKGSRYDRVLRCIHLAIRIK